MGEHHATHLAHGCVLSVLSPYVERHDRLYSARQPHESVAVAGGPRDSLDEWVEPQSDEEDLRQLLMGVPSLTSTCSGASPSTRFLPAFLSATVACLVRLASLNFPRR